MRYAYAPHNFLLVFHSLAISGVRARSYLSDRRIDLAIHLGIIKQLKQQQRQRKQKKMNAERLAVCAISNEQTRTE